MTDDRHVINTGSDQFSIVVNHYGDAKGTKDQFQDSDPSAIDPLIDENYHAYQFATLTVAPQLQTIKANLAACWQGESADHATDIVNTLSKDAQTIGTNTKKCNTAFLDFQSTWTNLKSQAQDLYEGVMGSGMGQDNDSAHYIYKQFNDAMQHAMHTMPAQLVYNEPLNGARDQQTPGPGPGPVPGGPGNFGPGPGNFGPGPGSFGPGPGDFGPGGNGPGSYGPGGGGYGPGTYGPGPGNYGPGSYGPGNSGPGSYGPGSYGPGGGPTASTLAGYDGGAMGPGATGPGAVSGPGGPGSAMAGAGTGLSGGGTAATGGAAGGAGAGVGAEGTGAGRGGMMMPMRGSGQDGDGERERGTWLTEDDSVWGAEEAPPGLIT